MYINYSGSQVVSGELLCTAGQRQYLLLRTDDRSGGVWVLAGGLSPAATLLFLLCCFSSGCWWMQSVALVSVHVCNSVSVAVQLLDKRFSSSASFSLVIYVKNLRWFTRPPPHPHWEAPGGGWSVSRSPFSPTCQTQSHLVPSVEASYLQKMLTMFGKKKKTEKK